MDAVIELVLGVGLLAALVGGACAIFMWFDDRGHQGVGILLALAGMATCLAVPIGVVFWGWQGVVWLRDRVAVA